MTKIRFIIQGSTESAVDVASELKQYLLTELDIQTEAKAANSGRSSDTQIRGVDLVSGEILVFLNIYVAYKTAEGLAHDINKLGIEEKLQKLSTWVKENLTQNGNVIWLEVNNIPYPVKTENLDEILRAVDSQK